MKKLELSQLELISGGYCDPRIPGPCINTCIVEQIYNTIAVGAGLPELSCI